MRVRKVATNFAQVSNIPLYDARLSWKAKGVFAYMFAKPEDWDFSSDRMKHDSKDGREALLSALQELVVLGYLRRRRLPSGKMEYELDYNPKSENPIQGQEPKSGNPTVGKPHGGKSRRISNTEESTNTEEKETLKREGFETFWSAYPKKKGKKMALKAWEKISLSKELLKTILDSLENHKLTEEWTKEKKRFVPHPATWLNGERWNDEVDVTPATPKLKAIKI